ncbi:hypothetical protein WMY93_030075 [Mugilogobius chulae]|uniref:Uncharacterized protein n=1 Tax=Mugilogobius chulae TaxID=88201 RepID=A0AAW0MSZ8_9GOBI
MRDGVQTELLALVCIAHNILKSSQIKCIPTNRHSRRRSMRLDIMIPTAVLHSNGTSLAKQLGAETYLECSAFTSEKSIHSVFRTASQACVTKLQESSSKSSPAFSKDRSKSCCIM